MDFIKTLHLFFVEQIIYLKSNRLIFKLEKKKNSLFCYKLSGLIFLFTNFREIHSEIIVMCTLGTVCNSLVGPVALIFILN